MNKKYAGIGSRDIDEKDKHKITRIALFLQWNDCTLVSGEAKGTDTLFKQGAAGNSIIYRAKDCTEEAKAIAESVHPAWHRCNEYDRTLLGRNVMIILGEDLKTPVDFVVCWTKDPLRGGTSLGIKIAELNNIPVFNMFNNSVEDVIKQIKAII
jgi:hypothetical protein